MKHTGGCLDRARSPRRRSAALHDRRSYPAPLDLQRGIRKGAGAIYDARIASRAPWVGRSIASLPAPIRRLGRAWAQASRVLDVVALVPLAGIALLSRRSRQRRERRGLDPRIVLGTEPVISLATIALTLRAAGYQAETWVTRPGKINTRTDFDRILDVPLVLDVLWVGRLVRIARLARLLRQADIVVGFFSFSMLGRSPVHPLEDRLFRLAGTRLVFMPYGSDSSTAPDYRSAAWRDALASHYPATAAKTTEVRARVARRCRPPNFVIANLVHFETLPRRDVLVSLYYPIETDSWRPSESPSMADGRTGVVRIIHTPNHRLIKGTAYVEAAVEQLQREGLEVELVLLEGVQNREVRTLMPTCDILVEQLLLGYALSAIEGLSCGLSVVSNLSEPGYYELFRESTGLDECPIVSATPATVTDVLRRVVTDPGLRQELSASGRRYAVEHHSVESMTLFWHRVVQHVWAGEAAPGPYWNAGVEFRRARGQPADTMGTTPTGGPPA